MIHRKTLALIYLCLSPYILFSQEVRFDHFDITNELSQNNIRSLIVDELGYIWAGTLEGLSRFDGYKFEVFTQFQDERGNSSGSAIRTLGKSKNGNIWLVTVSGDLYLYDSYLETFRSYNDTLFEGFSIINTNFILETNDGNLWLAGNYSVLVFNPEKMSSNILRTSFSINGFEENPENKLILASDSGLYEVQYINDEFEQDRISSFRFYNKPVNAICRGEYNRLFGIVENHLMEWEEIKKAPNSIFDFTEMGIENISSMVINDLAANRNEVWISGTFPLIKVSIDGSPKASKYKYDSNNPYSFKGRRAKDMVFDKTGNLWIGTSKQGLNLLEKQKNQFQHYHWKKTSENRLAIDPVRCITKTRNGDLWFSFDGYGVGVQHENGEQELFLDFYHEDGSVSAIERVRSIYEDSKGNIWFGAYEGLGIYNKLNNRIESAEFHYNWKWPFHCYVIKEFEPGFLTISGGPNIGMLNLSSGALTAFPLSNNNTSISGNIRDIVQDQNRNYWIALGKNGIIKIDFTSLEYTKINPAKSGLSDNNVYSFLVKDDNLWIGTNTGINIYSIKEKKTIKQYFVEDGLANNIIYSIYDDVLGNIWISTNNGLSCFDVNTQKFTNYLMNDFFMDDAHFKSSDGQLYFGGYNGVVSFYPEEILSLQSNANPVIENFYLFNKLVKPLDTIDNKVILNQSISKTKNLKLSYLQNSFSFSFNSFPFHYPNNNQYRYKLGGPQEDWSYSMESNRTATFTGLPPGKYAFQLSANSGSGLWSEPLVLNIEIVPPFWKRRWFQFGIILLLILTIYLTYRRRLNEIKKRNIQLKEKVDEQTFELKEQNTQIIKQKNEIEIMAKELHEIDEAKLRFFTNISHEFRTPLTLILGHIENLGTSEFRNTSRSIKNNALRLLRLVNQLIDIRKLDQDQMRLHIINFELVSFIQLILDSFEVVAAKKNIDLLFISSVEQLNVWLDMDKTDKILYNLISNAIKYTPENKGVTISLYKKENTIEIYIKDQGIGISKEDLKNIFNRFYRGQTNNIEGHGIGLSLAKSLTEIQNGTISVTSEKNHGSEFKIAFKSGKEHFNPDDIDKTVKESVIYSTDDILIKNWEPFSPGSELLLVEDNDELSLFLKDHLSKHYKIICANNGKEALNILEENLPELIISDIMMPEMDGITFCRKLKNDAATSHIPIILLTAKNDIETKIEGFEMGIDAYIEKPFNTRLLLIQINSILKKRESLKRLFLEQKFSIDKHNDKFNETDKKFWYRVVSIIDNKYSQSEFTMDKLSREINMSRSSFYRKFISLTGMGPGDYLRKYRLRKAISILSDKDISISQISSEVGFQSVSHFRKTFKEEYGKTPTEWKNSRN